MSAPLRVVLADDDEAVRGSLADLLSARGFVVAAAVANGAGAVAAVEAHTPDVALLDVRMPIMGGIKAARHIARRSPSTSIVMLSAYDDPALESSARSAGAAEYIVKGLPANELLERIRAALGDKAPITG